MFIKRKLLYTLTIIFLFAATLSAQEKEKYNVGFKTLEIETKERKMVVAIWYPTTESEKKFTYKTLGEEIETKLVENAEIARDKKFPIIFFSHGAGGCGLSSWWISEELARAGMVVISPDYNDEMNIRRINESRKPTTAEKLKYLKTMKEISKKLKSDRNSFEYRPKELNALITTILQKIKDKQIFFSDAVDIQKIAVAGHSMGAFTSLAVSGAWKEFKNENIKSAVILSTAEYYKKEELQLINIPIMFMAGTKGKLEEERGPAVENMFNNVSSSSKFLALVKNANHFSFADYMFLWFRSKEKAKKMGDEIANYVTNFLKWTLNDDFKSLHNLKKKSDLFEKQKFELPN